MPPRKKKNIEPEESEEAPDGDSGPEEPEEAPKSPKKKKAKRAKKAKSPKKIGQIQADLSYSGQCLPFGAAAAVPERK